MNQEQGAHAKRAYDSDCRSLEERADFAHMTNLAYVPGGNDDPSVHAAAAKAIELIEDGARVGLGSGRAVMVFIAKLGARSREGLNVTAVAASEASTREAMQASIPLIALGDGGPLDITVDGADEVAPNLDLLKGRGGAMVRERIIAAASASQVIIVGQDKLVRALGERGTIPVEVIPFAEWLAVHEFERLGLAPRRRLESGGSAPLITENGNLIIDCALPAPISDGTAARELERALLAIVGVVDTGLFLGTADRVIVGQHDGRANDLSNPRSGARLR
jgi:ribose 5-phosphate isomerase A